MIQSTHCHRAERRKAQQRQFLAMAGIAAANASRWSSWSTACWLSASTIRTPQTLQRQDRRADKQIDEIQKPRNRPRRCWRARKSSVPAEQSHRGRACSTSWFASCSDGLYLKGVKQDRRYGQRLRFATSNARVSTRAQLKLAVARGA